MLVFERLPTHPVERDEVVWFWVGSHDEHERWNRATITRRPTAVRVDVALLLVRQSRWCQERRLFSRARTKSSSGGRSSSATRIVALRPENDGSAAATAAPDTREKSPARNAEGAHFFGSAWNRARSSSWPPRSSSCDPRIRHFVAFSRAAVNSRSRAGSRQAIRVPPILPNRMVSFASV